MEKSKQLVSMLVGILIVVVIVIGLVWLSNGAKTGNWFKSSGSNTANSGPTPEETARILQELSKPVVDANGKVVPPPTPEETSKILKELSKPPTNSSGQQYKKPTPEETARILQELSKQPK
jgi:hypothetical protein